ncbi:Hsc70-interacting protein, putative [Entamoeba nuttalli P19]|uniref:Hsc70-interacting protein, putative n=1 Tax=Entamoeba nuttalli (strain P19) TaxID=1076696 RepID=K2GF12_ENTNP|nr:Hsc70-interacting protein, putative [Entamoeba nuttalli P19]EKE41186.1 Hsc70-interacting protein, putative [Entamoeba nuttalli P19]|eukprot:XP_008856494.1 Hsc70-interacting protein, putative [Entamoeba nuttalli P19]
MDSFGVTNSQIQALKVFINLLQQHPEFLNDDRLDFLRNYIISLGGKIPEPKKEEPKSEEKPMEEEKKEEETVKEKPMEEDIKIDDPDVIPGDTIEPETINMDIEVTEEMEVQASTKRSEAMEAFNNGEVDKAINTITEAIKLNPRVANFFACRAQYYNKAKKPNAAIRDCTTAIKLNPDNAKAYKMRGMAYRMIGQYQKSVVDLRLGNKLDYDDNTYELQKVVEKFVAIEKQNEKRHNKQQEEKPKQEEQHQCHCGGEKKPGCDGHGGCHRQGGCCDPELMAAMQDPDVMTKLSSAMSNPAQIATLMSDPKVGPILNKLMSKFGQNAAQ